MTKDEIGQIGEEMVKVLGPVYEQLDRIERVQQEHGDKIDALTVDVKQLQDDVGGIRDDIKGVKDTHKKDISEIREQLGVVTP